MRHALQTLKLATFAAAAALALASGAPALADDGEEPFYASYAGHAAFTGPSTVAFQGEGLATHLGRSQDAGEAMLMFGAPASCSDGIPNVHVETLTAANGDTLTVRMDDVACPIAPMVFHGTGHWTVVAGTGRFEAASGDGTVDGHADFNTGDFHLTLTGTLLAPRQARR